MSDSYNKNIIEATKYFISIVKFGTIRQAKDHLGVDTNTIKNKVSQLEKYLDQKLLTKRGNSIVPTEYGLNYFINTSNIYESLEHTIESLKGANEFRYYDNKHAFLMPAGFSMFFANTILPKMGKEFPRVSVNMHTYSYENAANYGFQFRERFQLFDLIIIHNNILNMINPDDWVICFRGKERFRLYTTNEYLYQVKKISSIDDLKKCEFVCRNDELRNNALLLSTPDGKRHSMNAKIKYRADFDIIKAKLLESGLGVGFLHPYNADNDIGRKNLVEILPEYQFEDEAIEYLVLMRKNDNKYLASLRKVIRSKFEEAEKNSFD
ncbi:LysR family transcriptional regulator [Francisellaceae bacterium]|nr:LysR family transcriptional regulator [Francisellaceae bacterium]